MFHIQWYWRCNDCKIDADSYKDTSPTKAKASNPWDTDTDPMWNKGTYLQQTFEFNTKDVHMPMVSISTGPSGLPEVEVKITAIGTINSKHSVETFEEKFYPSNHLSTDECDMWDDIAVKIMRAPTAFYSNYEDIKKQYLISKLTDRYPNAKIVIV